MIIVLRESTGSQDVSETSIPPIDVQGFGEEYLLGSRVISQDTEVFEENYLLLIHKCINLKFHILSFFFAHALIAGVAYRNHFSNNQPTHSDFKILKSIWTSTL